jgi:hypothetical protein
MANWTVKQVTNWLKENGFKKQIKIFKGNYILLNYHSLYFNKLEKNIDGNALLRLTDQDISQLFSEIHEDGTIQEPTIGVKSRFRLILTKWKMNNNNNE